MFEKYVLKGYTYCELSSLSGYSISFLEKKFHSLFEIDPPHQELPQQLFNHKYLILDGLWFEGFVMMMYRTYLSKYPIKMSFMGKEFGYLIDEDLQEIKEKGFKFLGIVSDGGTGIKKAVHKVYRFRVHQICLAHVTRSAAKSIGKRSKAECVNTLRDLIYQMWKIETMKELNEWHKRVKTWEKVNRKYIYERRYDNTGRIWYAHKGAKKAYKTILKAKDTSFKFLNYKDLPKTTNKIEGQFGNIVKKHLAHSGLKVERVPHFLKWYRFFYIKNLKDF